MQIPAPETVKQALKSYTQKGKNLIARPSKKSNRQALGEWSKASNDAGRHSYPLLDCTLETLNQDLLEAIDTFGKKCVEPSVDKLNLVSTSMSYSLENLQVRQPRTLHHIMDENVILMALSHVYSK